MPYMSQKRDKTQKEKAASGSDGQDQDPVQADPKRSSTVWDSDQHSDAPGPFGTGSTGADPREAA